MIEFLVRIAVGLAALFALGGSNPGSGRFPVASEIIAAAGVIAAPASLGPSVTSPAPFHEEGDERGTDSLFGDFLRLGVRHILTGGDHLVFLLGLLLVCDRLRSVLVIISCFTLAHSGTLVGATLNVFALPDRLLEPLIAVTIIAVGVENLLGHGELKRRSLLAFVFGLIHGFAFASVLRSMLVEQSAGGLALPLFSFNLGVEMGQIAMACVIVPVLWQFRRSPRFARYGTPVLSAMIALIGLYWLFKRTVFS